MSNITFKIKSRVKNGKPHKWVKSNFKKVNLEKKSEFGEKKSEFGKKSELGKPTWKKK